MITTVRGVTLHLFEYDAVAEAIRQAGDFYEADILDDLRARHPLQGVIVDAGANLGNHAAYWSSFVPHDGIVAFEPVPESFELLQRNLANDPATSCYRMALSDHEGQVMLAYDQVNRGRCRVADDGTIPAPCMRLDDMHLGGVTLLKVDVEGHQAKVIAGAAETIERSHPSVLVEDEDDSAGALLRDMGYLHVAEYPGANHLWEWAA